MIVVVGMEEIVTADIMDAVVVVVMVVKIVTVKGDISDGGYQGSCVEYFVPKYPY